MRKIQASIKKFLVVDDEILTMFEKEVTAHGTGGKIPCSSRYIGKKVYVIVRK